MSSPFINSRAILKAVEKATEDWGFCRNRVWAIAKSLPSGPDQFPTLLPSEASHAHKGTNESHQLCTFDFFQQSRVNFTLVKQRHESGCDGNQCKVKEFSTEHLVEAIEKEKPTAWYLAGHDEDRGRILEFNERYMAISHVWSDGTGVGDKFRGHVNTCLFSLFRQFAQELNCEGLWWDTIYIPTTKDLREKALKRIQQYYKSAAVILVHDCFLRECEWFNADLACFHIMISPWFSRGWTALELKISQNVEVIFKGRDGLIIKNIDRDILGGEGSLSVAPEGQITREILKRLRQDKISQVNDLVAILGSHYISWPRDTAILSGLMIRIDLPETYTHQRIYQEILQELGEVSHAHLFHNSATITNGYNWCPTNLYDLPVASTKDTLQVEENGNLFGKWVIMSIDHLSDERFISGHTHPLIAAKVELARQDKDQHILLIEPDSPKYSSINRGLLVRPLLKSDKESRAIDCYCDYVGPVYFHPPFLRTEIEDAYKAFLFNNIHIGHNEELCKGRHRTTKLEEIQSMIERMRSGSPNTKPTKRQSSSRNSDIHAYSEVQTRDKFRKAAILGELKLVQSLLLSGKMACLNKPDISGWSALHHATWNGHTEVVKLLVRRLDAPEPSAKGQEPIHLTAERGYKQIVELLLEISTPDLQTKDGLNALHLAARYGHSSVVSILLANKWNINAKSTNRQTALHIASLQGHEQVVQTLCALKANHSLKDHQQNTALLLAASKGYKKTTDLLRDAGAALDNEDEDVFSPLHLAVMRDEKAAIEVFVHIGVDIEVQSMGGYTPLHIAALNGHSASIKTLVGLRANLEARAENGETPLHVAARGDNSTTIQTLVDLGSDLEAGSRYGETPLHVAASNNVPGLINTLVTLGANLEALTNDGQTPLHKAAWVGHFTAIKTLVDLGANPEAEDSFKQTPLDIVIKQGTSTKSEMRTYQYLKDLKSRNAKVLPVSQTVG
ncbi:hypothetical protein N7540_000243 [Penicillium herquei]|nr:hypothetical protein N7540_000243 [Penicillium herquei]